MDRALPGRHPALRDAATPNPNGPQLGRNWVGGAERNSPTGRVEARTSPGRMQGRWLLHCIEVNKTICAHSEWLTLLNRADFSARWTASLGLQPMAPPRRLCSWTPSLEGGDKLLIHWYSLPPKETNLVVVTPGTPPYSEE